MYIPVNELHHCPGVSNVAPKSRRKPVPVTILKPLHGSEPELSRRLSSWYPIDGEHRLDANALTVGSDRDRFDGGVARPYQACREIRSSR